MFYLALHGGKCIQIWSVNGMQHRYKMNAFLEAEVIACIFCL